MITIEANGKYQLTDGKGSSSSVIYAIGSLGGAVVTINYLAEDTTLVPIDDGTMIDGGQYHVEHGRNSIVVAEVSGYTAAIKIGVHVGN